MRLPEQRLWDSFSSNVQRGVWLERIENGLGAGMPDIHSMAKPHGFSVWVELKAVEAWPKRSRTAALGEAHGLNVEQRNWHLECARHGGKSVVLVGVGVRAEREIFLIPGKFADRVNKMNRVELREFLITWAEVFRTLTGARL